MHMYMYIFWKLRQNRIWNNGKYSFTNHRTCDVVIFSHSQYNTLLNENEEKYWGLSNSNDQYDDFFVDVEVSVSKRLHDKTVWACLMMKYTLYQLDIIVL